MGKSNFLVTGGAGYLGSYLVKRLLSDNLVQEKVIVYSRDELKHFRLKNELPESKLKFVIGDVRDPERLLESMQGIEVVIHAAAMKHLDICEQNPEECIKTNVLGTENVIRAAKHVGVKHLIFISTDKAVEPVSVYGNSKQTAEKLILRANSSDLRTYVIRLGNLFGSSGSFIEKVDGLPFGSAFTLFHPELTRFVDSNENAFQLVLQSLKRNFAGCVVLPKVKAIRVIDFIKLRRPDLKINILNGRTFEKVHERLVSTNEISRLLENEDCYLIPNQELSESESLDFYRALPSRINEYDSSTAGFLNEGQLNPSFLSNRSQNVF